MVNDQMVLAEKLTLRRARVATVLGVLFIVSMATSLKVDVGESRPATLQIAAWVVWAAALLFLVTVGGGLFRSKFVRSMMNDDTTVENRRIAMVTGFLGGRFVRVCALWYKPIREHIGTRGYPNHAIGRSWRSCDSFRHA